MLGEDLLQLLLHRVLLPRERKLSQKIEGKLTLTLPPAMHALKFIYKDAVENLDREKTRNKELEKELKKKEEVIDKINKQLSFLPELMGDLAKKNSDLKRSKKEKENVSEELRRLKELVKLNDAGMSGLEKKREKVKLMKQIEAQNEELEQVKGEMRKLKEESEKVNAMLNLILFPKLSIL